ncbi:MAG: peptide ABC transporter permease [Acidobacteria bacterium]|nr:MAG: peptide ABC transporter permease [Acidobacteriota bacterium]
MSRIGLAIVILFTLAAIFAPALTHLLGQNPYDPVVPAGVIPPTPPGPSHPLGTDSLGRDLLARLLYGARISLSVGVMAEGVALLLGLLIGGAAGLYGGRVDEILMRLADIFFSLPAPLVALAVIAALPDPSTLPGLRHLPEPSLVVVFLVLGLIGWAGIARLVRGQILVLRELDYTAAARALGAGDGRLLMRHLLPNALAPVLATATLGVAGNILAEAWLSFLGVGAHPPLPSWGIMITEGQNYLTTHPWLCIYPGLALLLSVLGLNLFGDGLREGLDPRLQVARQ